MCDNQNLDCVSVIQFVTPCVYIQNAANTCTTIDIRSEHDAKSLQQHSLPYNCKSNYKGPNMSFNQFTHFLYRFGVLLILLSTSCSTIASASPLPKIPSSPVPQVTTPFTISPSPTQTTQPASAAGTEIPFPRLGMWWPDPWEQSLDEIARYD